MDQTYPADQEQYELLDEEDYIHINRKVNGVIQRPPYCGAANTKKHAHRIVAQTHEPYPKFCPECGKPVCPYCLLLRYAARGI